MGIVFASKVLPEVFIEMNPPDCCILSNADLSTTKSFIIGKAFALNGSM